MGVEAKLLEKIPDDHRIRPNLIVTALNGTGGNASAIAPLLKSEAEFQNLGKAVVQQRRANAALSLLAYKGEPEMVEAALRGMKSAGKDKKFKPISVKNLPKGIDKDIASLFRVEKGGEPKFLKTEKDKKLFAEGKNSLPEDLHGLSSGSWKRVGISGSASEGFGVG